jgi:Domain of unknown function (DUF4349)
MHESDAPAVGWRGILLTLAAVACIGVVAMVFMGTQVSRILSTVGSSVSAGCCGTVGAGTNDDVGSGDSGGDEASDGEGGGGAGDPATLLDAARPDLLIIKTGEISIRAASIGPAVETVTNRIVAVGGYASGSTRSGQGDQSAASITFRVPSARWEAALEAARGAGEDVLDEQTHTEDVTGDVVDLQARIRNLRATEAALQAVMTQAGTIEDILAVQSRLTEVQGEIEQLSSKAADLQERASFSTLTVNVRIRPAPVIAVQEARFDPGREAEGATAQLVGLLQAVATAGIWTGIVWLPALVFIAVVAGVGVFVGRRVLRAIRTDSDDGAPLPEGTA